MSRDNSLPFERGSTFYQGSTIDTNDLGGTNLEGKVYVDEGEDFSSAGVKASRNGGRVVLKVVRNMSGITILPKRLVVLDPTNPGRVTGYNTTEGQECYPVDEFLPAAGVPHGDLFYIVIAGPAIVLTPMTGAEFGTASIAAGAVLVGLTTSGASTATGTTGAAGRAAGFVVVAATTVAQIQDILDYSTNWVGRAMSAMTSGQTHSDILIDVKRGFTQH